MSKWQQNPDFGDRGRFFIDPSVRHLFREYKRCGYIQATHMADFIDVRTEALQGACAACDLPWSKPEMPCVCDV